MKYRSKTIRKAPEHIRPLMKMANELDTQLNRLRKSISTQIEVAEGHMETANDLGSLRYSMELANQKRSSSEPDPQTVPPVDDEEYIDIDIPDELAVKGKRQNEIPNVPEGWGTTKTKKYKKGVRKWS